MLTNAGEVSAALEMENGHILIAGDFHFVNGVRQNNMAMMDREGRLIPRLLILPN